MGNKKHEIIYGPNSSARMRNKYMGSETGRNRKPKWLKFNLATAKAVGRIRRQTELMGLSTVCKEAECPNRGDCAESGVATFMILGNKCSRNCRFCAVEHGEKLQAPDPSEPQKVAMAVESLGLDHVVITSVTRDDLPDGGANQFTRTIYAIRERVERVTIEILTPDFQGCEYSLDDALLAEPDVFNHNMETVRRLYGQLRPQASYERSLSVLGRARDKRPEMVVKSGLMVGVGETVIELGELFEDLAMIGVTALTIGQYLSPAPSLYPVHRYLNPTEFDTLGEMALKAGIPIVISGPLVRSSYKAKETLISALRVNRKNKMDAH